MTRVANRVVPIPVSEKQKYGDPQRSNPQRNESQKIRINEQIHISVTVKIQWHSET